MGRENVFLRAGDGFHGWPEKAPFDAIVLSCAAEEVPKPLLGGNEVLIAKRARPPGPAA